MIGQLIKAAAVLVPKLIAAIKRKPAPLDPPLGESEAARAIRVEAERRERERTERENRR